MPLEQLATEFKLRTTEVIDRVQGLEAMGRLTGVMDERGKVRGLIAFWVLTSRLLLGQPQRERGAMWTLPPPVSFYIIHSYQLEIPLNFPLVNPCSPPF